MTTVTFFLLGIMNDKTVVISADTSRQSHTHQLGARSDTIGVCNCVAVFKLVTGGE